MPDAKYITLNKKGTLYGKMRNDTRKVCLVYVSLRMTNVLSNQRTLNVPQTLFITYDVSNLMLGLGRITVTHKTQSVH